MKFAFIAKHRSIWPVAWLCEALGVSRSGFHAWLNRSPSQHARYDEALLDKISAARRFGQGYDTVRYTASAILDLAAHQCTTPVDDIERFEYQS